MSWKTVRIAPAIAGSKLVGAFGTSRASASAVPAPAPWAPVDTTDLVDYWDPVDALAQSWTGAQSGLVLQMGTTAGSDAADPVPFPAETPARVDFDGTNDVAWISGSNVADHSTNFTASGCFLVVARCADAAASNPIIAGRKVTNAGSGWQYAVRIASTFTPDRRQMLYSEPPATIRTPGIISNIPSYISDGSWFTIGCSWDFTGTNRQIYFENGAIVGTTGSLSAGMLGIDTAFFSVGAAAVTAVPAWDNFLSGSVGHIFLYDGYKSPAEIAAIHNDLADNFAGYGLSTV